MCGVPHHAVDAYIQRLIDKGYKVAIVEQLEDPSQAQGIVKRGVIQIITPGTIMENKTSTANNFIAAVGVFDFHYALAFADLTTGEMMVETIEKKMSLLENELLSQGVREVVVSGRDQSDQLKQLAEVNHMMISLFDHEDKSHANDRRFKEITDFKQIKVASLLLNYLEETQKRSIDYIQPIREIRKDHYLEMDIYTKNSLELTQTIRAKEKYGSLLWLLDHTQSAMGSRLLKQWIDKP